MLSKAIKSSMIVALAACSLYAGDYNAQAEKDRKALIKYFEDKFENPEKNAMTFFPYSTDEELKNNIKKGIKHKEFGIGNYAFNKAGLATYDEIKEMPPYEDNVDVGREIYEGNKALQACFPDLTVGGDYPYFDEKKKEVVSLTGAINKCLTDAGQKKWNEKKGKMADFEALISYETMEARKKLILKLKVLKQRLLMKEEKSIIILKGDTLNFHVQTVTYKVQHKGLEMSHYLNFLDILLTSQFIDLNGKV